MSGIAGLPARLAAGDLIQGVLSDKRMLSELVEAEDSPLTDLTPPERARAQSLAIGVLRSLHRLDGVLARFLNRAPPAQAKTALRICAYELLAEGTPAHAAVDSVVRVMRARQSTQRLSGLANAVGRRIAAEGAPIWESLPSDPLPKWIATPVRKAYGAEGAASIAAACRQEPAVDLTPKDPARAEELAKALGATLLPTGSLRLVRARQISALPGYAEGDWWVQDAAAAMPARLLGDVRGKRVLDLCAAPGGKTLQLAAAGAEVAALDISAARLERVAENLARTGLSAELVTADALNWDCPEPFDAILLDAPCSATGTLRRHPDLPYARPDPDLRPLLALQADLIDRAAGWLKPGGLMVYCTCSLLPKEGELQIARALERNPTLARATPDPVPVGTERHWWSTFGDLRLRPDYWPDLGGMDGFFATLLKKTEG